MKKGYIVFVILLSCLNVWSQAKSKSQYKFGFKLGTGMQAITGRPVKTRAGVGFLAGVWVQIKISKSWTIQSELNKISKEMGLGLHQARSGDYWIQLAYFEVPILFQYNKKNAYFEFGPTVAALINGGEYTKDGILPYNGELYPFSNKDISFNLGTGFSLNQKWRIGLRLTHSLLPVRKQLPGASHQGYNRGIVFSFSRQISFKASKNKQAEDSE